VHPFNDFFNPGGSPVRMGASLGSRTPRGFFPFPFLLPIDRFFKFSFVLLSEPVQIRAYALPIICHGQLQTHAINGQLAHQSGSVKLIDVRFLTAFLWASLSLTNLCDHAQQIIDL